MTVSSLTPVNNYTGNGSVTTFDFDFLIENQNELVVTHTDKNGISNVLEFGIDYSINEIGDENGSYINFPIQGSKYSVLANDEVLSLALSLQIKQESEFANSSNLNLNILEKTFDYLVRILQILNRKIERSIKVQEGSSVTPDVLIEELKAAERNASISSSSCEQLTNEARLHSENATRQANVAQEFAKKTYDIKEELVQGNMYKYQLFDVVEKDYLLSYEEKQGFELFGSFVYKNALAGSRYGYPDFYNKCLEEKTAGTATDVTLGENTVTMYINANGHQFFDIADKDAIDAFYNATGTAWFYGIDTTNERILLPRCDYVELTTKDKVPVVGNCMTLGLTDGTANYGLQVGTTGQNKYIASTEKYGTAITTGESSAGLPASGTSLGVTTDSSKSGIEADLSTYSSKKYYYMVVGNTKSTSGYSEIVEHGREILLQVNDGIESRADISLSNVTRTSGLRKLIEVSDSSLSPSWYKVFEETNPQTGEVLKWCEQGGDNDVSELVFLKEFADTNYVIFKNVYSNSSNALPGGNSNFYDKTTTGAKTGSMKGCWLAMGYIN